MPQDVQFEEENRLTSSMSKKMLAHKNPGMVNVLLKAGIVKNEKQSYAVLLAISIVCILLAIGISGYFFLENRAPKKTIINLPAQLQEQLQNR